MVFERPGKGIIPMDDGIRYPAIQPTPMNMGKAASGF